MSSNKELPHVVVLPEDQANADIVNGFLKHYSLCYRAITVLKPSGGWSQAVDRFIKDHVSKMSQYPNRYFVLLVDFDKREDRRTYIKRQIPDNVKDRVFILGVFSNPEELRRSLGKDLEWIGESLSANCSDNTNGLWEHDLLRHNQAELELMISCVKPFLFNQAK